MRHIQLGLTLVFPANLETYATLSQTAANGEETEDLVSAMTNQLYIAQSPETFAYDDDGNQTLITTKTGLWRVTYNGENRPIRWVRDSDNTTLTMSYDHMGRRCEKNTQHFFYDGYLQIANFHSPTPTQNPNYYIWDCTEPVATRPLAWCRDNFVGYYAHDGNKNVSEVLGMDDTIVAHYEYAPFGAVTTQRGESAAANPWRFSSEYAEDDTATVYYNYRHYEPVMGRWISQEPLDLIICNNAYALVENDAVSLFDILGLHTYEFTDGGVTFDDIYSGTVTNKFGERIKSSIGVTPFNVESSADCDCNNGAYVPNFKFIVEVYTIIQNTDNEIWNEDAYGMRVSDPRVKDKWNSFWIFAARRRVGLVKDHEARHRKHARKNYDNIVSALNVAAKKTFANYGACIKYATDVAMSAAKLFRASDDADSKKVERGEL